MEFINNLSPLFTAGAFFLAFFAVQFGLVYFLLNAKIEPLKENQARFDDELKELKAGQARFDNELKEIKADIAFIKQTVIAISKA